MPWLDQKFSIMNEDGSSLRLDVCLLDSMNGLLGESDLMSKLILAETQHCPGGSHFSGKRRPLNPHDVVELQTVRVAGRFGCQPHSKTHSR